VPRPLRLAVVLALSALALGVLVLGAAELETAPLILSAKARLPPDQLAGEHFRVFEIVRNDGFMNHWRIDSDWGLFEADSDRQLAVRLREIEALAVLEQVTTSQAFKEAFEQALTGKFQAAREVVEHPVETAKRIPDGVLRMLRRTTRRARNLTERSEEKYGELKEKLDERRADQEAEEAADETGEATAEATDAELEAEAAARAERRAKNLHEAGEVAKDIGEEARRHFLSSIGYRKARRGWAKSLGVDPYGDNEPLDEQLLRVSIASTAGGLPVRFAPLPTIPGLAELSQVKSIVYDLDSLDLRLRNEAIFFELGFTRAQVDSLYDRRVWNDTLITDLADAMHDLESVPNLEVLMHSALAAADRDEARFQAAVDGHYAHLHRERSPVATLVANDSIVGVRLADGTPVLALAVDHLAWTETAAELLEGGLIRLRGADQRTVELHLAGDATETLRREVEARQIRLVEHAF